MFRKLQGDSDPYNYAYDTSPDQGKRLGVQMYMDGVYPYSYYIDIVLNVLVHIIIVIQHR